MNLFFFTMAWISLALGVIGIFLPLLPTTPFLILSAYCFSKSSEKWHQWLLSQPQIGPMVVDWREKGVIRLRAKLMATVLMLPLAVLVLVKKVHPISLVGVVIGCAALLFVWSRPSR